MLNILILRNAKRSIKDYLIYIGTMTIIAALMFAFHGMIFSKDMRLLYDGIGIFAVLIGLASVFIILIVAWLIRYMVNFMLERRSKEFGTYLLLGMTKKQIIKLFRRENYLLGLFSVALGLIPGYLLQLVFVNIFYSVLETDYQINPELNGYYLLLTIGVMGIAYLLAFRKAKRKIKKMTIRDFIGLEQKNEQIASGKSAVSGILFFLAISYMIFFNVMILVNRFTVISAIFYSLGLVLAIYLLYVGLSAFLIYFIQKKSRFIYRNTTIFILRQLASKIKSMRFTMGTLTVLFTGALLSWMVVMMFADFQQTQLKQALPFDVAVFNAQTDYSFNDELALIGEDAQITESYVYKIYQNGTHTMNDYLYENVKGTQKGREVDGRWTNSSYFGEDTYMKESDYNRLRQLLGYQTVHIKAGNYLLQGKERLKQLWETAAQEVTIQVGQQTLSQQAINTDPFSQSGINGADYLIVVPDESINQLTPYFSILVADLSGAALANLQQQLEDYETSFISTEQSKDLYAMAYGYGSDQILTTGGTVAVKDIIQKSANFSATTICFVMAYIGIVFMCAALTILGVQQLSDASKYKKRYRILNQLGLSRKETERVVLKQLSVYYFAPYLIAIFLSIFYGFLIGERFVYYSGVQANPLKFYGLALATFSVIYLAYFVFTYVGFTRSIQRK